MTTVFAQNTNNPYPPTKEAHNFYIEATAGANAYYVALFSSEDNENTAGFGGYGWSTDVGYSFSNNVALEAGIMQNYILTQNANPGSDESSTKSETIKLTAPYVATRFTIQLGKHFEFIPKIGLMGAVGTDKTVYNDNSVDKSSIGVVLPFVGLGCGYKINRSLEVTAQYQGAVYGVVGAGLVSAGLAYHF